MPESRKHTEQKAGEAEQTAAAEAAGATPEGAAPEPLEPPDERVWAALHAAGEKKALDLVLLDLRLIASFTDFFLIASGTNVRQVQAIADAVVEELRKHGSRPARVEGYNAAEWVLLDYGDFILHVFEEKARRFYDLERLWRDAARVPLPAGAAGDAGGGSLRTE